MQSVIDIKNLSVYYDNVCALSNINLKIEKKDFLGIIGPNGGGKSTLIKIMLGLIKPSSGSVRVFGKPPLMNSQPIGYVPQFTKFDKSFPISVLDVVLMGRIRKSLIPFMRFSKNDIEIANNILRDMDIFHLKDRQIGCLSGGQLQRVLIARALATKPEILILDEPTASIDSTTSEKIYNILNILNEKITIIIVTHDTGAISTHVKNVACLNTKLYYHGLKESSNNGIQKAYGCNIELIGHGIPHRVLKTHKEAQND